MLDMLMNEVILIHQPKLRSLIHQIVLAIPLESWKLPSSRNHHLIDERGEWGNLIHTVRVTRICQSLADTMNIPSTSADILRAAAILHDCCKHGLDAESVAILPEHPRLVRELLERLIITENIPVYSRIEMIEVIDCIEVHMGRWGNPPYDWEEDGITISFLLHIADYIEAHLADFGLE